MDVTKVKVDIDAARAKINTVRQETIAAAGAKGAGRKEIQALRGILELGRADTLLEKVAGRLDKAVEIGKEKAPKVDKKTAKK